MRGGPEQVRAKMYVQAMSYELLKSTYESVDANPQTSNIPGLVGEFEDLTQACTGIALTPRFTPTPCTGTSSLGSNAAGIENAGEAVPFLNRPLMNTR